MAEVTPASPGSSNEQHRRTNREGRLLCPYLPVPIPFDRRFAGATSRRLKSDQPGAGGNG